MPPTQGAHGAPPPADAEPAAHAAQTTSLVAVPALVGAVPAGHAEKAVQAAAPAAEKPFVHGEHWVLPAAAKVPAAQTPQTVSAEALHVVLGALPAAHGEHGLHWALVFVAEKKPGLHAAHAAPPPTE